jgi:hypothetical protein
VTARHSIGTMNPASHLGSESKSMRLTLYEI